MADNKTVDNGALTDYPVATDEVTYSGDTANVQLMRVVHVSGAEGARTVDAISDATNGVDVDVTRVQGTVTVDGSGVTQPVSHAALTELAAAIDTEVQVDVVGALPAGDNNIGNVDIVSVPAPLSTTGGGTEAAALRVTVASDSTGVLSVDDNGGSLTVDNAGLTSLNGAISGTEVQVDVVAALPTGTNSIGKVAPTDIDVTLHTNYAKKYYTNAGAVTDGIVWSPAAGKRWHVTCLVVNVSAACTVTFEDDLGAGDSAVMKFEFAANSGVVIPFGERYPLASGEDAADLIVTTTAGNIYITATGYEI